MPFVIAQSELPTLVDSNEWFLNCLLTIQNDFAHRPRRRARLYVDAVEIPIKEATWSEQGGPGTLDIQLARLSDRSAFTRTASIKLDSEAYISGVWTVVKTYCDGGILDASEYEISNSGNTPSDSFSVTVKSVLQQKLDLTPDQIVVLYDPAKVAVEDSQLEVIPNIDGTLGTVTVTPVASLTLQDAFDYLATLYGCVGAKTNINATQWPLTRVDFPAASPYWNTVAGIIGNHNARPFIDADNYLVIKDGTLTDYLSARTMTISNFQRIRVSNKIERYKGCKLDRQMQADSYDTWELRKEDDFEWFDDVVGQYPMTHTVTWYQDFYKIGVAIPVNSQPFSVRQLEYEDASTLVSATAERFSYRFGQGAIRMTRQEMKEWGIANVPSTWVTFNATIPGPMTEFAGAFDGAESAYTATNVTSHSEAFVLLKAEQTGYAYRPLKGSSDQSYSNGSGTETRGLITTDAENQQLGSDFEQPWTKAQENGNLAEGQNARWGVTDFRKEKQKAERKKRQVDIRTRRHSKLNGTSGLIAENYHDRRVGDIGESDIQTEAKPVYITENGDATASLWRSVNGGEAPIEILQPLCHRLNKQQDYPGGIDAPLAYYDETIEIGVVIDPRVDGRASVSIGIHEVTSYTDVMRNVSEGGFQTTLQARQIG